MTRQHGRSYPANSGEEHGAAVADRGEAARAVEHGRVPVALPQRLGHEPRAAAAALKSLPGEVLDGW